MQGPYPVDLLIKRLTTLSALKIVGGAGDFEVAKTDPPRNAPAVYALTEETGGRSTGMSGCLIQEMTVTVKLVVWVRHAGEADTGGKAAAEMGRIEPLIRDHVFGWRPSTQFKPLLVRASGADTYHGSHLVRQLLFQSGYRQTTRGGST